MYLCCLVFVLQCTLYFHVYNCRYDPQKSSWEPSKGMTTLRSRVGVAVVDRKLYAFGGYDGSSRLFTVECFDPEVSLLWPLEIDLHTCTRIQL